MDDTESKKNMNSKNAESNTNLNELQTISDVNGKSAACHEYET